MSGMLRRSDQPPADGWRVGDIPAVTAFLVTAFLVTPFATYLAPPMGILLLAVHRDAATGAGQPR